MRLLLHCCCAPCALPLIEYLKNNTSYEIILFYSNSNIFPQEEYHKRFSALKDIAQQYNLQLIEDDYNHDDWLKYLKNNLPASPAFYQENQERCLRCFEFRMLRAITMSLKLKIDIFATTLSVSRFKNTVYINNFAQTQASSNNIKYYQFTLDPVKSYERGRELVKQYQIYSQKYCGCEFSINRIKFKRTKK